jgi:hypothetical protein
MGRLVAMVASLTRAEKCAYARAAVVDFNFVVALVARARLAAAAVKGVCTDSAETRAVLAHW